MMKRFGLANLSLVIFFIAWFCSAEQIFAQVPEKAESGQQIFAKELKKEIKAGSGRQIFAREEISEIKAELARLTDGLDRHEKLLSQQKKRSAEAEPIEYLANTVSIIGILISVIALIATILGAAGYVNIKGLFEEKFRAQERMIETLQPIFEKRALQMAERDLTTIMENLYLRDTAVLNQRRAEFTRADIGGEGSVDAIMSIFLRIEEFSDYVSLLFIHPTLPLAGQKIQRSLYYFREYPSYYIVPCLKAVRLNWRENEQMFALINEVLEACEGENPATDPILE